MWMVTLIIQRLIQINPVGLIQSSVLHKGDLAKSALRISLRNIVVWNIFQPILWEVFKDGNDFPLEYEICCSMKRILTITNTFKIDDYYTRPIAQFDFTNIKLITTDSSWDLPNCKILAQSILSCWYDKRTKEPKVIMIYQSPSLFIIALMEFLDDNCSRSRIDLDKNL